MLSFKYRKLLSLAVINRTDEQKEHNHDVIDNRITVIKTFAALRRTTGRVGVRPALPSKKSLGNHSTAIFANFMMIQ